jgi:tetratricopeptide (TPR) repeat protein
MAEKNINNSTDDFLIVWLDGSVEDNRDNQDTKALIRRMVRGRLLTFKEPDPCVDLIFVKNSTQKVSLIVSNKYGNDVVAATHDLPQVQSIYIYCGNRQIAEEWTKPYGKVSGIFTNKKMLLSKICDDIGACDTANAVPMSVFHMDERQNSLQNLTEESATFMWYRSMLHVLLLMAKYCDSKTEMIAECRASYHNDEAEKKKINQFEITYKPETAFWWYTYDSFVYRLLNQALRTQSTEIIFKFRFFINDLHIQIVKLYHQYINAHSSFAKRRLTVYRGQRMKINELDVLRRNVNEHISMNSFLSATTLQQVAEVFADTSDQCDAESPLQSVLFIIEICDINKETTPFAFIENYSCCADEEEVLFTIGAIFKVESVKQEGKTWHVKLKLSKQQNELCKDLSSNMLKQIGSDPGPLSFGWFLYRMNDLPQAERYAELMLKQFPADDKETGNAYNLLGLIYHDIKRYKKSIECYQKALAIYSRFDQHNSPNIIATHYNLGLVYLALEDIRNADEHRQQAKGKLINSSHRKDPHLITMVNSLTGKMQIASGDYIQALKVFEAILKIKEDKLGANHPSIASTLNDLGIVQENMGNDHKALAYFNRALEIRQKSLPPNHLDVAECLTNLSRVQYRRKEHGLASRNKELAAKIAMNAVREEEAD